MIPLHIKNKTKSPKIILNVCQNILHHGIMCPIKSGACLDDPEKPNRYQQADLLLKLIVM